MIDLKRARKAFEEYIAQYNPEDKKIDNKIQHIKRVAEISRKMAIHMGLCQEEIKLAELIGLLHDIGRFEQVRKYHTFIDKISMDHGEYGVKILFEEAKIRDFITEDTYDTIIKIAILNHNRAEIQEGLTQQEIQFCQIIRDADKTDILYVLEVEDIQSTYCCDSMYEDTISPEIVRQYKQEHYINYQEIQNGAERMISHFAYVFNFYHTYGLKIVQEANRIDRLANKYEFAHKQTRDTILEMAEIANQEIKRRLQ